MQALSLSLLPTCRLCDLKSPWKTPEAGFLYFHTQLTSTLVSAAIAGHMTEAVAGMTVWALATRGGRPREGGGQFAGGAD